MSFEVEAGEEIALADQRHGTQQEGHAMENILNTMYENNSKQFKEDLITLVSKHSEFATAQLDNGYTVLVFRNATEEVTHLDKNNTGCTEGDIAKESILRINFRANGITIDAIENSPQYGDLEADVSSPENSSTNDAESVGDREQLNHDTAEEEVMNVDGNQYEFQQSNSHDVRIENNTDDLDKPTAPGKDFMDETDSPGRVESKTQQTNTTSGLGVSQPVPAIMSPKKKKLDRKLKKADIGAPSDFRHVDHYGHSSGDTSENSTPLMTCIPLLGAEGKQAVSNGKEHERKQKLSKDDIGVPSDFRHVGHIGAETMQKVAESTSMFLTDIKGKQGVERFNKSDQTDRKKIELKKDDIGLPDEFRCVARIGRETMKRVSDSISIPKEDLVKSTLPSSSPPLPPPPTHRPPTPPPAEVTSRPPPPPAEVKNCPPPPPPPAKLSSRPPPPPPPPKLPPGDQAGTSPAVTAEQYAHDEDEADYRDYGFDADETENSGCLDDDTDEPEMDGREGSDVYEND
ncbi:actin nucleation-promoting factor WAS-like isoform X2 [Ptychodera flava]|uniref:actin nucleation-promoting factor WAS-like isoform X2 n=1 Tax=Ptychodera flava TaxID=63121 RepID=UPI00396A3A34